MTTMAGDWHRTLRRYLVLSIGLHFLWEVGQLPLYTIWTTTPLPRQVFAIAHCTLGDAMIAGLSLLIALTIAGSPAWPAERSHPVWIITVALGVTYTIYSEWLNVNVRGSWAYSDSMPIVPVLGTGLSPVLLWLVVPTLAQWAAIGRRPWIDQRETPT